MLPELWWQWPLLLTHTLMVPTPKSHPFPTLLCVPHPCLELGEELGTECERDGKLPVAARGQGLSVWCQGCGRSGRGGRLLCCLPTPLQCSQLSGRLVQFVTLGPECTVCFKWPLSSPTLAVSYLYSSSSGILLSSTSGSHLPTSPCPQSCPPVPKAHRVSLQSPQPMERWAAQ